MFQTGLRDKGKPHTWLTMWVSLGSFVEAEGSNWHQNPPLRVCIYVCEKVCVMSPYSLVVRAPLQFNPGQLFYGKPAPPLPPIAAPFLPHPRHARSHDVFVSALDKTGGSLGPPISPPPWGDMGDEWRDPQTVHAYNLSLPFGGCTVIATQIAPCFHKDLLLYLKAWPTAPKKKRASGCNWVILSGEWDGTCSTCCALFLEGMQGWLSEVGVREGEFFSSIIKWHKQQ